MLPFWSQNGRQNVFQMWKIREQSVKIDVRKSMRKKARVYATAWWGRRVGRDATSNVLNISSQDVLSSSCKRLLNVLTSTRFAFWHRFATHIVSASRRMWIRVRHAARAPLPPILSIGILLQLLVFSSRQIVGRSFEASIAY